MLKFFLRSEIRKNSLKTVFVARLSIFLGLFRQGVLESFLFFGLTMESTAVMHLFQHSSFNREPSAGRCLLRSHIHRSWRELWRSPSPTPYCRLHRKASECFQMSPEKEIPQPLMFIKTCSTVDMTIWLEQKQKECMSLAFCKPPLMLCLNLGEEIWVIWFPPVQEITFAFSSGQTAKSEWEKSVHKISRIPVLVWQTRRSVTYKSSETRKLSLLLYLCYSIFIYK